MGIDSINERCQMYTFISGSVWNPINIRIRGIWLFTVKFSVKIQPDKQWMVVIARNAFCQVHAFQHDCQEQYMLNLSQNNNCDRYVMFSFVLLFIAILIYFVKVDIIQRLNLSLLCLLNYFCDLLLDSFAPINFG